MDHTRIGESCPGEGESETNAHQQSDDFYFHHAPPNIHANTWANATAVAKNVIVATRLAGDPSDTPVSPCPDVQPPAVRAPTPMARPASTRRPTRRTTSDGSSSPAGYISDGENVFVVKANNAPPITMPTSRNALKPAREGRPPCSL